MALQKRQSNHLSYAVKTPCSLLFPLCHDRFTAWRRHNYPQSNKNAELRPYRLTQVGIFLAFTWPGFFLSTLLGSLVTQPAVENTGSANHYRMLVIRGNQRLTSSQRRLQSWLKDHQSPRGTQRNSLRLPRSTSSLD